MIVWLVSVAMGGLAFASLQESKQAEAPREFRLEVVEPGNPAGSAKASLTLNEEGYAAWQAEEPFALSFAKDFRVILDSEKHSERSELDVRVNWMTTGPENPNRRFRVALTALDGAGAEVFRTWQTQSDNRIGPVEIEFGSFKGIRSTANSMNLALPWWAIPKTRALRVELKALAQADMKHVAPSPSEINLRMTRPDADGNFELVFTNPQQGTPDVWALAPEKHQAVVTLHMPNREGGTIRRFIDARADGSYRVPLRFDLRDLDEASVTVIFWTRQPDHERFVERFFGEGKGGGYRGLWHQSGGPLVEVPFE